MQVKSTEKRQIISNFVKTNIKFRGMPLFFRRSIKILPGFWVNFGKKSTSVSFGPRGAKVTKGTNGTTVSVGVPGTGVYYRKKISSKKKSETQDNNSYKQPPMRSKSENKTWGCVFLIIGLMLLGMALLSPLQTVGRFIIGGIGAFCLLVSTAYFTAKSSDDRYDEYKSYESYIAASRKGSQSSLEINWFPIVLGVILIAFSVILFTYSLSWSWTGHSKYNIYITYDYHWFKWVLYPILLFISILGIGFVSIGFTKKN